MSINDSSSKKAQFVKNFYDLLKRYEEKINSGILFKLERNKSPLEILGVLNFLKFKIKKWGNVNIYTYLGDVLNEKIGLIIGAIDLEEALSITIVIFLSDVNENEKEVNRLCEELTS